MSESRLAVNLRMTRLCILRGGGRGVVNCWQGVPWSVNAQRCIYSYKEEDTSSRRANQRLYLGRVDSKSEVSTRGLPRKRVKS